MTWRHLSLYEWIKWCHPFKACCTSWPSSCSSCNIVFFDSEDHYVHVTLFLEDTVTEKVFFVGLCGNDVHLFSYLEKLLKCVFWCGWTISLYFMVICWVAAVLIFCILFLISLTKEIICQMCRPTLDNVCHCSLIQTLLLVMTSPIIPSCK